MKPFLLLLIFFLLNGCGAAIIGGAAATGYKTLTDERSVGNMIDDSIILTKVKTQLISDWFIKARQIDVDVLNGIVYLIGIVDTDLQKKMASDIAISVEGVKGVENQLIVGKKSLGNIFNDSLISSKIKVRLLKDPDIKVLNIDVDTNDNVITLTGIVGYEEQKKKIISIARSIGGKRQIIDNILIRGY